MAPVAIWGTRQNGEDPGPLAVLLVLPKRVLSSSVLIHLIFLACRLSYNKNSVGYRGCTCARKIRRPFFPVVAGKIKRIGARTLSDLCVYSKE